MVDKKKINSDEIKVKQVRKKLLIMKIVFGVILIAFTLGIYSTLLYYKYQVFDAAQMMKPIIYLYPEEKTQLSVKLGKPENVTCSYPDYASSDMQSKGAGWSVIANPDGKLIDVNTGRSLYALYWEGKSNENVKFDNGFVVKREDTISFLEDKLDVLGLNEKEAEEFIVYWLPRLQENEYNLIRFADMEEINKDMPLEFSVEPDTLIRVWMQFKGLKNPVDVKEQSLKSPERKGFVAVEWGGSELK